MLNAIKSLLKNLSGMLKVNKTLDEWSLTSFITFFISIVPVTIWAVISIYKWELISIPESVLVIILAGITGKVVDKFGKLKNEGEPVKDE